MDSRLNGQEADVIQFGQDASKPDRDQLDAAGQTILQLIHRAAGLLMKTADARWKWRRSFHINCERPKIASRS
jgi:hypothetical protein